MLYIDHFLDYLKANNRSKKTIYDYAFHLKKAQQFFAERKLTDEKTITETDFIDYMLHLKQISTTNWNYYNPIEALKRYFRYLETEGIIFISPAKDVESPKPIKKMTKVFSIEEVEVMFSKIKAVDNSGIRFRTVMELLYSSALRPGEVIRIKISDIDFNKKLLFIHQSKGKKDRVVPLTTKAVYWLRKYKDEVRPKYLRGNNNYLFISHRPNGKTLESSGLHRLIKSGLKRYDIEPFKPSLMRATAATHLLLNGMHILYIKKFLGHARSTTTQIYLRTNVLNIKQLLASEHPRLSLPNNEAGEQE